MRILILHSRYVHSGGEDTVLKQEQGLLEESFTVETLLFQNKQGIVGAFQFFCSIWNVIAAKQLREKIRSFKPDVIHIHNWHFASGPIIIRVANKMGVPIIHTLHNYRLLCPSAILFHENQVFTESLSQNFPWSAVKRKVYRNSILQTFWLAFIVWFHKKIGTWNKINTYICLTDFSKQLYQNSSFKKLPNRFIVKPNFIASIERNKNIKREEHFLFIGRLSIEKGLLVLLNAIKNTKLKVKIAGDGPLKDKVQQMAKENQNIIYLGILNRQEVQKEMRCAEALIFPSIWYEGMPMTIIEAFSESTPIIASNIGAMSIMIEHNNNGLLFKSGDSSSLQKQLENWSRLSSSKKNEMSNQSFITFEEKYSKSLQLKLFDKIFGKIIK